MTHDAFESLIPVSLAGGLTDEELAGFEAHRAGCGSCARALEAAEEFERAVMAALEPQRAPDSLADNIVRELGGEEPAARQQGVIRFPRWVVKVSVTLGAAALMIIVGVAATGDYGVAHKKGVAGPAARNAVALAEDVERSMDTAMRFGVDGDFDGYVEVDRNEGRAYGSLAQRPADAYLANKNAAFGLDRGGVTFNMYAGTYAETTGVQSGEDFPGADIALRAQPMREAYADVRKAIEGKLHSMQDESRQSVESEKSVDARFKEYNRQMWRTAADKANNDWKDAPPPPETKPPEPQDPEPAKQMLIRNGSVWLEVEKFDDAYRSVEEIVSKFDGYVGNVSREKLANGKIRGDITVRVPSKNFSEAMTEFRALGELKNQNVSAQDVTKAYIDNASRLRNAKKLETRLLQLIENKGEVKDLLEVEKELGKVRERIEQMTGQKKYYDDQVSKSTISLSITEKDIERPAEYVETQKGAIHLVADDIDAAYAAAKQKVADADGQVLQSNLNRGEAGAATATIKARIKAEMFRSTFEALKELGVVVDARVDQSQSSSGTEPPAKNAKLRRRAGVVDLTISTPLEAVRAVAFLQIELDPEDVGQAYSLAVQSVKQAKGELEDAQLAELADGMQGRIQAMLPLDQFDSLVQSIVALGKKKEQKIKRVEAGPLSPSGEPIPRKDMAIVHVLLTSTPRLVPEESGISATLKRTFSESATGVLWSIEMLIVGAVYVLMWGGPIFLLIWLFVRGRKRAKAAASSGG